MTGRGKSASKRGIAAVLCAVVGASALVTGLALVEGDFLEVPIHASFATLIVGGLMFARAPGNRIGWIMMVAGLLGSFGYLGFALWDQHQAVMGLWLGIQTQTIGFFVIWGFYESLCATPDVGRCEIWVANPLSMSWVPSPNSSVGNLSSTALSIAVTAGLISLAFRYRGAIEEERQQIKWIVLAALASAAVLISGIYFDEIGSAIPDWLWMSAFFFIPVAIGLAILRYRLYDIDRIISRTLGYVLVVIALGLVYAFGAVWLPTRLIGDEVPPVFVAGSTLAVIALFNPVRKRILSWVDRRFYRSRYDAEQVVAEFSDRLRDQTDVDRLTEDWVAVVTETMQPSSVGVWIAD